MNRNLKWTRNELVLALNLYYKTPFGKMHKANPNVIELALILNRTPSAVSWKLVNFASFDESLQARGIVGARNASRLDKEIWEEFYNNLDLLAYESENLLLKKIKIKKGIGEDFELREGLDKERLIKTRVNQSFFRSTILASYNCTCCITGIQNADLLIAGHIVPWSKSVKNRLNPRNGILTNLLHDKAFDLGYITINEDYKVLISSEILSSNNQIDQEYFNKYHGQSIILPSKFLPDKNFLRMHNNDIFLG
jgi:putative restriction endonuclease